MGFWVLLFLIVYVIGTIVRISVEWLNLRQLHLDIPVEFSDLYDQEKYRKSQEYLKDNTRISILHTAVDAIAICSFIPLGGFSLVDTFARALLGESVGNEIFLSLLFFGILSVLTWVLGLPFSIFHTFVIEEKYGFNRSTVKTFVLDQIKAAVLGTVLGGAVLSMVIWFFESFQNQAWLYAWAGFTVFQLFLTFFAPVFILPLFNRFLPLPEGKLREEIEKFALKQDFKLQGIFTMDGSKRSTKANAYFTGFGKFRRIVLFDTLVSRYSIEELVSVLAHEIGHYKCRHIPRQLALSIASTFVLFFLFSVFQNEAAFTLAFGFKMHSLHAALVVFTLFYGPFGKLLGLSSLWLSRKYEFEADAYARSSYGHSEALISALKKLSVESLSSLRPHPLKVFLDYSHPPVLRRVERLSIK